MESRRGAGSEPKHEIAIPTDAAGRNPLPTSNTPSLPVSTEFASVRNRVRAFCDLYPRGGSRIVADYNLLFRWFLDLNWDEPGFNHSSFSRNPGRLLEHDVAGEFFRTVVAEARELKLTSDEHFRNL